MKKKGAWKENGVVLDSEDEDEDEEFDTQSTGSSHVKDVETYTADEKSLHAYDHTTQSQTTPKLESNAATTDSNSQQPHSGPLEEKEAPGKDAEPTQSSIENDISRLDSVTAMGTSSELHRSRSTLATAIVEPIECSPEELPSLSQLIADPAHSAAVLDDDADDISLTYVRLSSPTPTLSSIDTVQVEVFRASEASINDEGTILERATPIIDDTAGSEVASHEQGIPSPPRRSFRPRTSIQLHPYLIEGEKHRHQFRGAHIAPLKITNSSQEQEPKRRKRQNEDSQDTEFVTEGESQESGIPSGSQEADVLAELLSSPARRLCPIAEDEEVRTPRVRASADSQEDEDLPDITDLVQAIRTAGTSSNSSPRQRPVQRNIEEVMPQFDEPIENLPAFLRIAARSAGSRHAIGRQGPARKFVRLDNREATAEAQTVLRQWRGRSPLQQWKAKPKRAPLRDVLRSTGNARRHVPPSAKQPRQRPLASLRIPKVVKQTRIQWPVKEENLGHYVAIKGEPGVQPPPKKKVRRRRTAKPAVYRPAQLEITEAEYRAANTSHALNHAKRTLDRGYQRYRSGASDGSHLPLARFLDDDDDESMPGVGSPLPETSGALNPHQIANIIRRRKRQPKHIDAELAKYRQPETVVESIEITPTTNIERLFDDHLHNLGPPTIYSIDFDIKPLRSDVYFHEATFIGQGRLSKALRIEANACLGRRQHHTSAFILKGEKLKWNIWLDSVAKEMRTCFNWIIERLEVFANIEDEMLDLEVVKCALFIVGYFQDSLSANTSGQLSRCIASTTEPMECLFECLEVLVSDLAREDNVNNRRIMLLSTYAAVLAAQLLRLASTNTFSQQRDPVQKLEGMLQRATSIVVKLLFIIGFSPLDDLYEDLRQEAFRQGGIKEDHHPAQAWIILMHLVQAAKIPRFSIWNAVNERLLVNIEFQTDAKIIEQAWRSMFSLLPLMEFDRAGILKYRSRYKEAFENWALPQKLVKRVFDLYCPDVKNLSSYTNYCKAIFNRCHHLIQVWGWRRYGTILGTLFDFFATHKFSDISGIKADTHREFLTDLDGALSSFVVKEDQCFHVFLKILHSATRQLRDNGDAKEIRNLVTRLLPNQELQQGDDGVDEGSLKNHHDLLFTLYWAAPEELKHKIKCMLDAVDRRRQDAERPGSRNNAGLRGNAFAYVRRV